MKNIDLDSEIRRLRVPERDQEFWDAFPDRVLTELRAEPVSRPLRRAFHAGVGLGIWARAGLRDPGVFLGQSRHAEDGFTLPWSSMNAS